MMAQHVAHVRLIFNSQDDLSDGRNGERGGEEGV